MSRLATYFALRKFARDRFREWGAWIGSAGDAHRLVDIRSARKRVADAATEAGSGSAERFDFSGVVVGFVLKHHKPILIDSIDIHRHDNRGCVDFL